MSVKLTLFIIVMSSAACAMPSTFSCHDDQQCDSKSAGHCIDGACAFPASGCLSGFRYDSTAGARSNQCTAVVDLGSVDMGSPASDDLATSPIIVIPDLASLPPILDMAAPTCAQKGDPCTVGVGACARSGTVACTGDVASCNATAGAPDSGWHTTAAANGSWDWNCDGQVQFQYPSGTTASPNNAYSTHQCDPPGQQTGCARSIWIWDGTPSDPHGCGTTASADTCAWRDDLQLCYDGQTVMRNTVVGCH